MELSIKNINKEFSKKEGPSFILSIEELILKEGEVTFIMGHNGSGKSVLLKLLSGEINPSKNKISFSKKDITIGIVRQNASENLALELTVRQNLYLHLKPKTLIGKFFPNKELNDTIFDITSSHRTLKNKLDQKVQELSGGQKQALAFYAVNSTNPYIICLDEFLSATDQETNNELLKEITLLKSENKIILIVSHDKRLAFELADRILFLKEGKINNEMRRKNEENWNLKTIEEKIV